VNNETRDLPIGDAAVVVTIPAVCPPPLALPLLISSCVNLYFKNIFSTEFLSQKLEYIHNNPVDKEWKLVDDRADYKYSSACLYDRNIKSIIEVDDIREYL
jgi:hypothetical protein